MPQPRIIAVDNDPRILRALDRACATTGYTLEPTRKPEDFEAALERFAPVLIFLDLTLSTIDGLEILRHVAHKRPGTRIAMTSGVDERLLTSARALGESLGLRMLEPIRKPLTVDDIRQRLRVLRATPDNDCECTVSVSELGAALKDGRLDVCYQPMIDLSSRRVVCAEALARIRRHDGGMLIPSQFISVAEHSGLIETLTFLVLRRALSDLGGWQSPVPELQVSVNLSRVLLEDPRLPDRIESLLDETGVPPGRLVLEVTASGDLQDDPRAAETLSRMRSKGISLALDDFGTGCGSLDAIYECPYETLKLDKKFAICADRSEEAAAMIRSSLDLARSVGLSVVAEGIQSEQTLRWLGRLGCDIGQGFHISPPMSTSSFSDWLLRLGRLGPRRHNFVGAPAFAGSAH